MATKKVTKPKSKVKKVTKSTTKKTKNLTSPEEQRDVDLLVMINALNDAVTLINERLAIVNDNGQWACDQIQEIKDKVAVVSGRLGV